MANITLQRQDVDALRRLLWAAHQPEQDIQRWLQQGFLFQPPTGPFPLGLVQNHGGPCGVLAAVQAEILRLYLFPERSSLSVEERQKLLTKHTTREIQETWLVRALASILHRAATCDKGGQAAIHIIEAIAGSADSTPALDRPYQEILLTVTGAADEGLLRVLEEQLLVWRSPVGVTMFVLSVLRTKAVEAIREEMDDLDGVLTGTFGHCGQELLNLLLTGVASSNVFDGTVPMGDTGLMLRGIQRRPQVGYLTQLEALRYCQVGNYFKCPQVPVWVIASSSHFSVCMGLDTKLCESSASEMLFQRMQRVFKSFDTLEAGFLEIGNLRESLLQLGVSAEMLSSDFWMAKLIDRLEVSGAGIVLWDEYWKVVSVLVHTGDLELALRGSYGGDTKKAKSDEEIARELQAQLDTEDRGVASVSPVSAAPVQVPREATHDHFSVHYYNGLSRPSSHTTSSEQSHPPIVAARVSVVGRQEFIGQSVPFELSTSTGSGRHDGHPLEEVLKTKWTGAVFDWQGQLVPKID